LTRSLVTFLYFSVFPFLFALLRKNAISFGTHFLDPNSPLSDSGANHFFYGILIPIGFFFCPNLLFDRLLAPDLSRMAVCPALVLCHPYFGGGVTVFLFALAPILHGVPPILLSTPIEFIHSGLTLGRRSKVSFFSFAPPRSRGTVPLKSFTFFFFAHVRKPEFFSPFFIDGV